MRRLAFVCLSVSGIGFSGNYLNQDYVCEAPEFKRRVTLRYEKQDQPVPCESAFYRDFENYDTAHILYRAEKSVGRCEKKRDEYLAKMSSWGVTCTQTEGFLAPAVAREEVISPPAPARQVASVAETISVVRTPQKFDLGNLNVKLKFAQSRLDLERNGTGTFASKALNPGLILEWDRALAPRMEVVAGVSFDRFEYESTTADTLKNTTQYLWSANLGVGYYATRDWYLNPMIRVERRAFVSRTSFTSLALDPTAVPELAFQARYRLPIRKEQGGYVTAGAGYLIPTNTRYTKTEAGLALRAEFSWEDYYSTWPVSAGLALERVMQDTKLADSNAWNLALILGIRFDS